MMIYYKSVSRISVLVHVYLDLERRWPSFRYYISHLYIEDKNHNALIIISGLEFILFFNRSSVYKTLIN